MAMCSQGIGVMMEVLLWNSVVIFSHVLVVDAMVTLVCKFQLISRQIPPLSSTPQPLRQGGRPWCGVVGWGHVTTNATSTQQLSG